MKFLEHILRSIVGFIFIFSAATKLYPIEPFEIVFVDLGISNWLYAPFIARIIIALEIFLGLSILFNIWFNNRIYYLAQIVLSLFSVYLIYLLFIGGNNTDCGCFGRWIVLTPFQSLLKNIGLIIILLLIKKSNYNSGLKWIFPLVFLVVSLVGVFLLNKVGLQNVQGKMVNEPINLRELPPLYHTNKQVNFNEGQKIVIFLSVGCGHCKSVAYKLAHLTQLQEPSNVIVVLASLKEENIQPFFDDTGLKLPFIWMNDKVFFNYSGGKLPAFIYLEEGMLKKKWTGEFVKLEELEELFVLE